jgi:hypothetical protein
MRRSEKRKEEMYLAVELWQESGLSQRAFCQKEGLNYQVLPYAYKRTSNWIIFYAYFKIVLALALWG